MTPKKPRIPALCLHRPSGQGYVKLSGRCFYCGPFGTPASRAEYDRVVAVWLAAGRRVGTAKAPSDMTVSELAERYWTFAEGYYRKNGQPTSEMHCLRSALRPLRKLYGSLPINDFTPAMLKAVREVGIGEGHVRKQINKAVHRIRRMFRWGLSEGIVPPDVVTSLDALDSLRLGRSAAREGEPVHAVPIEYVDAIQNHVSRPVWGLIQVQLLTGARAGELVGLRPCDLDVTGDIWTAARPDHKGAHHGHVRTLYFGPAAQAVLRPFLNRAVDAPMFSPRESEAERRERQHAARKTPAGYGNTQGSNRKRTPKVSPSNTYTTGSYRRAIEYGCVKAGVPIWTTHQLRHARATAIQKKYGAEAARVVLGHHDLNTTAIYLERDAEVARRVAKEVG